MLAPEQQAIVLRQRDGAEKIARALRPWDEDAIGVAMVSLCKSVAEGVPEQHVCNAVRRDLFNYIESEKLRKHERIGDELRAEAEPADIEAASIGLPHEDRAILLAHYGEDGFTAEELAEREGVCLRTIHRRLERAKENLSQRYGVEIERTSCKGEPATSGQVRREVSRLMEFMAQNDPFPACTVEGCSSSTPLFVYEWDESASEDEALAGFVAEFTPTAEEIAKKYCPHDTDRARAVSIASIRDALFAWDGSTPIEESVNPYLTSAVKKYRRERGPLGGVQ